MILLMNFAKLEFESETLMLNNYNHIFIKITIHNHDKIDETVSQPQPQTTKVVDIIDGANNANELVTPLLESRNELLDTFSI